MKVSGLRCAGRGGMLAVAMALAVLGPQARAGTVPVLAAPRFSLPEGTYAGTQTVTITDATKSATIYYTTDGSSPTGKSAKYTAPLKVTVTETIKAIASAPNYNHSAVSTVTYTVRQAGPAVAVVATSDDRTLKLSPQPGLRFYEGRGTANPVTVDESQTYQSIEGFGAAFTDTAAYNLMGVAQTAARDAAVRNLFTRENGGIGLSFMRIPMAASDLARNVYSYDDMPSGQTDPALAHFSIDHDRKDILPLIREAKILNPSMKLMANPWSPPGWMKSNGSMVNGGTLLPAYYQAFANYFVRFVQEYHKAGVDVDYLSIQNEPTYKTDYPSMDLPADQATTVLSQYVLPALKSNKIAAKILLLDNNYYMIDYPETELANATIAKSSQVAGVAWHGYSLPQGYMQLLQNKYPALGQYETEHSGGTWNTDQIKTDFEDITAVLRNAGKTFVKWSLAVDQSFGPHSNGCGTCYGLVSVNSQTGALTYTADYYTLGQYSRFIQQGATRVYSSNAQGLVTAAFINPDGMRVLVVYNETAAPATFDVNWGQQSFRASLGRLTAATYTWKGTQNGAPAIGAKQSIQASSYSALDKLMTEDCSDQNAGWDLGYASDGSWAVYRNLDFGSGVSSLKARVASQTGGGSIEFHLDSTGGPEVAAVNVPNTGGWQSWVTRTVIAGGVKGVHDLYVVYRTAPSNLNWFRFY